MPFLLQFRRLSATPEHCAVNKTDKSQSLSFFTWKTRVYKSDICFKCKIIFRRFVFQTNYFSFSEVLGLLSPRIRLEFVKFWWTFSSNIVQHLHIFPSNQYVQHSSTPCFFAVYLLSHLRVSWPAFHGSEGCGNIAVPKEIEALPENLAKCCQCMLWSKDLSGSNAEELFNTWS